jgi:hypothetical protein
LINILNYYIHKNSQQDTSKPYYKTHEKDHTARSNGIYWAFLASPRPWAQSSVPQNKEKKNRKPHMGFIPAMKAIQHT